jgi:MFS transporter, PPP family, 3-phenylpropionic acid transporter
MGIKEPHGHLAVKLLFFLFYAGIGQFLAFLNVYFNSIGLSGTQIGLLGTISTAIAVISATLWGVLSDRLGKPRWLFMAAFSGTILGTLALSVAQPFNWIFLASCLFALFFNTLAPLIDSTALVLLGDQRQRYGTYRVWGSVGFILTSTAAGFIYQLIGLHAMFLGFVVLMGLGLLTALRLPDQKIHLSGSSLGNVKLMMLKPQWLIFAGCAFFVWLAANGMLGFLGVTIKQMGGTDSLVGLAGTVAAVVEIPGMFFSDRLLRRFGSSRLMGFGIVGYTLRMFFYAIMPAPGWVLAIGITNSITYMPFWIGAVAYASDHAPENMKATSQGLLYSITSLSSVVGGLFSGWLFDRLGPSGLFFVMGLSCLFALALFSFGKMTFDRKAVIERV